MAKGMTEVSGIDVLKWVNSSTESDMRANLPQKIYDAVLTKIFLGEIKFGQRIQESLITKELHVSNVLPYGRLLSGCARKDGLGRFPTAGARSSIITILRSTENCTTCG